MLVGFTVLLIIFLIFAHYKDEINKIETEDH